MWRWVALGAGLAVALVVALSLVLAALPSHPVDALIEQRLQDERRWR